MQPIAAGAGVAVRRAVVAEPGLGEKPLSLRRGPVHRLGHVRRNPARLAGFDVVDFVVPLVGHGVDLVDREVSRAATAKVPPICVSIGRTMLHIGRTQRARSELATP